MSKEMLGNVDWIEGRINRKIWSGGLDGQMEEDGQKAQEVKDYFLFANDSRESRFN